MNESSSALSILVERFGFFARFAGKLRVTYSAAFCFPNPSNSPYNDRNLFY